MKKIYFDVSEYQSGNLKNLDSVRGLMALFILGCHYCASFGCPFPPFHEFYPLGWLNNATIGLCYFFLLSGFVICYSTQYKQKEIVIWKYAANRMWRLLPPIAVSILAMWLFQMNGWLIVSEQTIGSSKWLQGLYQFSNLEILVNPLKDIFINSFFIGEVLYNCNLWAIRFEFLVPLAIVLISPFLSNRRMRMILLVFTIALLVSYADKRWFWLACMFVGSLGCFYFKDNHFYVYRKFAYCVLGGGIIVMSFPKYLIMIGGESLWRYINLCVALAIIYLIVNSVKNNLCDRIMNSSILTILGRISYEIYCFHLFFLFIFSPIVIKCASKCFEEEISVLIGYASTILAVVVFSYLFHKYVSVNLLKFKIK